MPGIQIQKKNRLEFLVTMGMTLGLWIAITFPSDPLSSLGFKNLIQHLILGVIFACLVAFITPYPIFTEREIKRYLHPGVVSRFILYFLRLILDIIFAGIDVARRILRPTILISPGIVEVETPLNDDFQISLNANSITLTPGTITIDVKKTSKGSLFIVHCISQDAVKEIMQNKGFVMRIQNCFGKREK